MKANVTPKAIVRIGKCLGPLTSLCASFSKCSSVGVSSSCHSDAKFRDDLDKIVNELTNASVFKFTVGRKHSSFPKFCGSITDKLEEYQMTEYITKNLKRFKTPCS